MRGERGGQSLTSNAQKQCTSREVGPPLSGRALVMGSEIALVGHAKVYEM